MKLEKLKYYRGESQHEFTLLLTRLSTYMTSQSFLFIAYPTAMGTVISDDRRFSLLFPLVLCTLGFLLSIHAHPGIKGAIERIDMWRDRERQLFAVRQDAKGGEVTGVDPDLADFRSEPTSIASEGNRKQTTDKVYVRSLRFAEVTPFVFGTSWVLLGVLTVYLHLTRG